MQSQRLNRSQRRKNAPKSRIVHSALKNRAFGADPNRSVHMALISDAAYSAQCRLEDNVSTVRRIYAFPFVASMIFTLLCVFSISMR
jgi:hypothetical protein